MISSRAFFLLLLLTPFLSACRSTAPAPRTAEVIYQGSAEPSTLTVRSVGYGETAGEAVQHAEESAFWTLLFRGIPGSPQANALVPSGETNEHAPYFDELLTGGRYATFMTESYLESEPEKTGRTRRAVVSLTINANALRRDLEQHGVIRKFGF